MGNHGAVASEVLGDALTQAVLDDWQTAPVNEQVKTMLGYLEKLTLHPDEIGKSDVVPLYAVGISQQAINEAIYICVLFNIIDRIADALNFALPSSFKGRSAEFVLKLGYVF
jgi:alkylhydroperoxidase family enzyme